MIHGRSTKPAKDKHAKLLKQALLQGLKRVDPQKAQKVQDGIIPVDYIYYGDVNNRILAEDSADTKATLEDQDPAFNNAPCLPDTGYDAAIQDLLKFKKFNKAEYNKVKRENEDMSWRDNLARLGSTLSAIATATLLNEVVIKYATADLGSYLMHRKTGSEIRERLQKPLKDALLNGDDVCLVAHSMGTMVAYDVLWKFSRMSEYRDVQNADNPVSIWLTLGAPLGEAGVKANLYDSDERTHKGETDKFPRTLLKPGTMLQRMMISSVMTLR